MSEAGRRVGGAAAMVLAVVLAVVLGALLLWPDGEAVRRLLLDVYLFGLQRGVSPRVGPEVYAAALNVLAFVPLGWIGVALLRRRAVTVAVVLVALSTGAELAQATAWLGRDPNVLDVACNGAGAVLGVLLASVGRGRHDDAGIHEPGDEPLHPGPDRLD